MAWAKPVDELELKFRMERAITKEESCDYHSDKGGYDADCYDCDVNLQWIPTTFHREYLSNMNKDGYIPFGYRVCSNSLKESKVSIREQVDAVLNKKEP